jgi:hypothetical protein
MKKIYFFIFFASILACKQNKPADTAETIAPKVRVPVEVISIHYGSVSNNLDLFATTVYLKRNVVTTPLPGFITRVNAHLGERVTRGQLLYELETKERRALGGNPLPGDTAMSNFGLIRVIAPTSGIVSTLDKQQPGDYVTEGVQLCVVAESGSLNFQVNVPYEYIQFARSGKSCRITLPDNSVLQAVFTTPLSNMNPAAQTQIVLAKSVDNLFLPENMVVKVSTGKGAEARRQVLLKACVLSDEMMREFWVMKLLDDSTAVKTLISIGNKNKEEIEVLSPQFNPGDKIISVGNYGLPDTASVTIRK